MPDIDSSALDVVAPFALIIKEDGTIHHLGRTIAKALDVSIDQNPNFFDLFSFIAPRQIAGRRDIPAACGKAVTLTAEREELEKPLEFRAVFTWTNSSQLEFLVLTSLGTSVSDAVGPLGLFDRDFSYPDCSVDLLYILDSRNELMRNAQVLNERIEKAKNLAENQARTDPLTGLANRRALVEFSEQLLQRLPKTSYLFHIDLDRFKQINDRLGHAAGDAILKRVADVLNLFAKPDDLVARIGGDEFIWVCTQESSASQIEALAKSLVKKISQPLKFGNQLVEFGASIGITCINGIGGRNFDDYLLEADLALYDVKKTGRGNFRVFTGEMMDRENIIQGLIRDIEPALENQDFVPYFQPQFDCSSQSIIGAEVLGRWLHPEHGLIPPATFLYVAERAKLIEKIDLAIFTKALDEFAGWKAQGIAPPHISLNLTAGMLVRSGFKDMMIRETEERGLKPSEITFELLETILVDGEEDDIREAATALSSAGFSLAIDDFGTGRASLTSLISVPVNLVKIDRAFVSNIHKNKKKQLLTEAIISVSKRLGLEVLAEGVENLKESKLLQELGCTLFQGYLFGKPASADAFTETLRDSAWIRKMQEDLGGDVATKTA